MLAFEPARRNLADPPAEAVSLHQQFDAVAEARVRLDLDLLDRAAREHAKTAGRVPGRWRGEMVQGEGRRPHQGRLEPGAALHRATRQETARADDITTAAD